MDILESSRHRHVPPVDLYVSVFLALFLIYSALEGKSSQYSEWKGTRTLLFALLIELSRRLMIV